MQLHFEKALQKQEPSYLHQLSKKILEWKALSKDEEKIVSNLYAEHFAPILEMEAFIADIRHYITDHADLFRNKVFSSYKNFSQKGDKATLPTGVTNVGFVLTRYTLEDAIKTYSYGRFRLKKERLNEFLNAMSLGPSKSSRKYDGQKLLSLKGPESTLWFTWGAAVEPFDFVKHNRQEEFYNALALTEYYKNTPIFIFRAPLADMQAIDIPLRPTVFDVGNYPHFRPPEPSFKDHGFTNPHNNPSLVIDGVPLVNDRRPEAIFKGTLVRWKDMQDYRQL